MPVTMPVMSLPLAPVAVILSPSMLVAWLFCWAASRSVVLVRMSCRFSTWVKVAVRCRNWVLSVGLMGFWYLSWATSSLRKVSLFMALDGDAAVPVAPGIAAGSVADPMGVVISSPQARTSTVLSSAGTAAAASGAGSASVMV